MFLHVSFFTKVFKFNQKELNLAGHNFNPMKKIKTMIESAMTKRDAMQMLETYRIFGNISESQYQKGRELIRK